MSSSIERLGLNASDSSHGRVQLHLLAVGAAQVGAKADKLDGDKAKPKAARPRRWCDTLADPREARIEVLSKRPQIHRWDSSPPKHGIAISTIPMASIVPQAGPNAPQTRVPLTRAGIPTCLPPISILGVAVAKTFWKHVFRTCMHVHPERRGMRTAYPNLSNPFDVEGEEPAPAFGLHNNLNSRSRRRSLRLASRSALSPTR